MNRRYFGTDGVRGTYGGPVINEAFAARLGAAAGRWLVGKTRDRPAIPIGWDTRFSGESLARALAGGLAGAGWPVKLLGVLPTPAISRAVRLAQVPLGVVITASHNPASNSSAATAEN